MTNAVPAQVEGAGSVVLVSPRHVAHDGPPHLTILAAAALLWVHEVAPSAVHTQSRPSRSPHAERVRTALTGQQSAIVLVDDLRQGTAICDAYAARTSRSTPSPPTGSPGQIRHAELQRSKHRPVALGDYGAGSNPTRCCPPAAPRPPAPGFRCTPTYEGVQSVRYRAASLETVRAAEDLPARGVALEARFHSESREKRGAPCTIAHARRPRGSSSRRTRAARSRAPREQLDAPSLRWTRTPTIGPAALGWSRVPGAVVRSRRDSDHAFSGV